MNSLHLKIKPYKCDACDKSFSRKCHLKSHVKRNHLQNLPDPESSQSSAPKVEPINEETKVSVSRNANLQDPLLITYMKKNQHNHNIPNQI